MDSNGALARSILKHKYVNMSSQIPTEPEKLAAVVLFGRTVRLPLFLFLPLLKVERSP